MARFKTIRGRFTGLKGEQFKLQDTYVSFQEFERYCEIYNNHLRLGFKTPQACWDANPTAQVTVEPRDYCRVMRNGRRYARVKAA